MERKAKHVKTCIIHWSKWKEFKGKKKAINLKQKGKKLLSLQTPMIPCLNQQLIITSPTAMLFAPVQMQDMKWK